MWGRAGKGGRGNGETGEGGGGPAGWGGGGMALKQGCKKCKAKEVRQQLLDIMTQVRGAEVRSGVGCHCGGSKWLW